MKKLLDLRTLVVGIALISFTGCTSETNSVPSSPQGNVYLQVDRIGRSGVKEIFEQFTDHSTSDRSIPANDPVLQNAITSFATSAGQSAAAAGNIAAALYPDELQLNLGASGNASYLGIETGTNAFGGRSLTDDVMSINLNAAFGNQISGGTVVAPCVVTDNVGTTAKVVSTFPYVAAPQ